MGGFPIGASHRRVHFMNRLPILLRLPLAAPPKCCLHAGTFR